MSTYKYDVQQDINNRTLAANAEQQNRQYWYDRQLQEQSQQFQIEEHQRNFEDWQKQFELENAEYERRIESQRAYDSISAQVGRAREIGVNPSAAIGVSQQGTAFAAPQPGTVNASSSPSSPSVSALPAQLHMPFEPTEQFLNIVESLSKLNKSAFSFVDQVRAQQLFMPQLEMAFNEVTNKQLQNAYDKVRNDIQGHTGLNKALSDVLVNYAQAYYHGKMGEKAEVDKLVSEAEKTLKGDQHAMFLIDLANLQEKYDLSFKLMKAQTNEADAAAGSYRADVSLKQAQTNKTELEATYQSYENDIKKIEDDATLSIFGKYYKTLAVINRLKAEASKNGHDALSNSIDAWIKEETDPRTMDEARQKVFNSFETVRRWIRGR